MWKPQPRRIYLTTVRSRIQSEDRRERAAIKSIIYTALATVASLSVWFLFNS